MFAVIYTFEVKEPKEQEFIEYWSELTNLIYKHAGSFGSRLHKGHANTYVAYALWPSETVFDAASSKLPEQAEAVSKAMRSCCTAINTEFKAQMIKDLTNIKKASI